MKPVFLKDLAKPEIQLASAARVKYEVQIGKVLSDDFCAPRKYSARPYRIEAHFPELYAWKAPRPVRYKMSAKHAVYDDEFLYLDASLVACMHPQAALRVFEEKMALLTNKRGPVKKRIEGPAYLCANEGSGTWGHWIVHNAPRATLFLEAFPEGRLVVPAAYVGQSVQSFIDVLRLSGISESRIISIQPQEVAEFEQLVFIDLPFATESGLHHPSSNAFFNSIKINWSLAKPTEQPLCVKQGEHFIHRAAKSREINNFQEISQILASKFNTVNIGGLSFSEQVTLWQSTKQAAGVLGSDFTNLVFGNVQKVFMLTPDWFGDNFFFGLAASLGVEWNELRCGALVQERQPKHKSSFDVNARLLEQLIN
jgi:capsular polysaccharide biosynthesis protein